MIASLAVVLLMLQQAMENVAVMAISITSGGGLGTSNAGAFMGLSQAAGMALSGLAIFGGAKLDEIAGDRTREISESNKKEFDYFLLKNVRETLAEEPEDGRGKRKKDWTDSAEMASFLLRLSASNLSDPENLKSKKKE